MSSETFDIRLRDLRIRAFHGVDAQEQVIGNDFVLNISITIPAPESLDDDLSKTISYADIYDLARRRMAQTSRLIETVAMDIAKDMQHRWPQIIRGSVEVIKLSVPIPGIEGSASVTYHF